MVSVAAGKVWNWPLPTSSLTRGSDAWGGGASSLRGARAAWEGGVQETQG